MTGNVNGDDAIACNSADDATHDNATTVAYDNDSNATGDDGNGESDTKWWPQNDSDCDNSDNNDRMAMRRSETSKKSSKSRALEKLRKTLKSNNVCDDIKIDTVEPSACKRYSAFRSA